MHSPSHTLPCAYAVVSFLPLPSLSCCFMCKGGNYFHLCRFNHLLLHHLHHLNMHDLTLCREIFDITSNTCFHSIAIRAANHIRSNELMLFPPLPFLSPFHSHLHPHLFTSRPSFCITLSLSLSLSFRGPSLAHFFLPLLTRHREISQMKEKNCLEQEQKGQVKGQLVFGSERERERERERE